MRPQRGSPHGITSSEVGVVAYGLTLSAEEHGPAKLVEIGVGVTCPTVRIHTAIERAHRQWPNTSLPGQLSIGWITPSR